MIVIYLLDYVTLPVIREPLKVVAGPPSLQQPQWLANDWHMLGTQCVLGGSSVGWNKVRGLASLSTFCTRKLARHWSGGGVRDEPGQALES